MFQGYCVSLAKALASPDMAVRPPELKGRTPAHTQQLGWYLECEFRVAQGYETAMGNSTKELAAFGCKRWDYVTACEVRDPHHMDCPTTRWP